MKRRERKKRKVPSTPHLGGGEEKKERKRLAPLFSQRDSKLSKGGAGIPPSEYGLTREGGGERGEKRVAIFLLERGGVGVCTMLK